MAIVGALKTDSAALKVSLYSYAYLRSALYTLEGLMGPALELAVARKRPHLPVDDPELFKAAHLALFELIRRDTENILNGIYPVEVLLPENPIRHLLRLPEIFREGVAMTRRRAHRSAHEFSDEAQDLLDSLPDYYQRNFHFQGDGYLSERSARLYDHQVEILFAGAGDLMRRLIIPALRRRFGFGDGSGLSFLELGAGTGRATRFVRLAFPKAKIVSVDLSGPYLKQAQANLKRYCRHDFVEGDAARTPFLSESFDAVYSVFLFHELPFDERVKVLNESLRVLKPHGFIGMVDSIQYGDGAELNRALERFPIEFHEPFYRNYVTHSMEEVFSDAGVKSLEVDTGFFSKVLYGRKDQPAD